MYFWDGSSASYRKPAQSVMLGETCWYGVRGQGAGQLHPGSISIVSRYALPQRARLLQPSRLRLLLVDGAPEAEGFLGLAQRFAYFGPEGKGLDDLLMGIG